ncbi:MAG: hypothetical protein ACPF9D_08230 [Owenweeksia sp.]
MALSTKELKRLKGKLLDGITPVCPSCGSTLQTEAKQKGESTSQAINYRCTRDNLPENLKSNCELTPGTAYSAWYITPFVLVRNRTMQLIVTAIVALMAGNYLDAIPGLKPAVDPGSSRAGIGPDFTRDKANYEKEIKDLNKSLDLEKGRMDTLRAENNALKTQLPGPRELLILGRARSWGDSRKNSYYDTRKAKDLIFAALEQNYGLLTNNEKYDALTKLSTLTSRSPDTVELFRLEKLIRQNKDWDKYFAYMGKTYYNLGVATDTKPISVDFRTTALGFYYCYRNTNNLDENSKIEMLKLLKVLEENNASHRDDSQWIDQFQNKYNTSGCSDQ